jgi:hypothetical protein
MYASAFLAYVSRLARRIGRLLNGAPQRRSETLVPRLFVRRLEERCVLNAHALNVGISAAATSSGAFAGGVYTPTSSGANVNTSEIVNQLNAGTNVTITTGSTGNESGDVTINAPIVWHSAATLTINAAGSIFINAAVTNTGTGGVELDAGGAISESGAGTIGAAALVTNSANGALLTNINNTVKSFTATNTISGDVNLQNTTANVMIAGITNSGGGDDIVNNIGGPIGITGVVTAGSGSVFLASAGTITESGGGEIIGFDLTINSVGGTVLNGANVVQFLRGGNSIRGNFELANNALTLDVIAILDSVGGGGAIRVSNIGSIDISGPMLNGRGNISLSGSGQVFETSVGRIVADGLELLGSADFSLTASGNHVANLAGNTTGEVIYHDAGSFAIGTVNSVGLTAVNKPIMLTGDGTIGVNSILAGGSVEITPQDAILFDVQSGTAVLTTGDQTYNGPIQLQADATLASTAAGTIDFTATIDGAHALSVDTAGEQTYNAVVGGTTPLSILTTDTSNTSGAIMFNMTAGLGSTAGITAGRVALDGTTFFNIANSTTGTPSVLTTGAQNYNGQVKLLLDTVLVTTSDGNVILNNTVDSGAAPTALTISAAGTIDFGNDVGSINPLSSVTSHINRGVTIAFGRSINTVTGAVSSAPPVLFVLQTTPQQEQVFPSQLTQTVYGYIGFAGAQSGYKELGQNYDLEVLWNDGSVTMSDTQSLAIARPSPGFGSFVGFGTVTTMTSVPGSPGVWTYNNTATVLPSFLSAAPANGITFAISHTYDINFVSSLGRNELTAVVKLVNNSSIQLSDPVQDGNIATGQPPSPSSLNAVQTQTSVPVTTGHAGVPTPQPFAPPAVVEPRAITAAPVIASTPPVESVNALTEIVARQDTVATERRMIEIVKLDPDGNPEKEVILTDVPEKLNELLEKLKQGTYRNGRYAVYLTEYSSTGNTVIGRRLLMEVYKSGHTLGDPVHEPGPGSNPIPKGETNQKTPDAPKAPAGHGAAAPASRIEAQRTSKMGVGARSESDRAYYHSLARRASISVAAAAAVIASQEKSLSEEDWASQVDRALAETPAGKLRRMGWLARARRRRG